MHLIRSFFKRITDDLKQKKLIPLKLLFFVQASTLFVLYPYLTIHMRELGINVEETAIMSAVTPVVSIVMPPLAGLLADKIGNFRTLLALSSASGGGTALLLLAVPVGRITVTYPPAVELLATCDGNMHLQQVHDYPCKPLHPYSYNMNLTVLTCGFVCEAPNGVSSDEMRAMTQAHSYGVHLQSRTNSQRLVYHHTISSQLSNTRMPLKNQSTSQIMTNNPHFNTTISKISDHQLFFPTPQLYQINCSSEGNGTLCSFGKNGFVRDLDQTIKDTDYYVTISNDNQDDLNRVKKYLVNTLTDDNVTENGESDTEINNNNMMCEDNFKESTEGEVYVQVGSQRMSKCAAACAALAPRQSLCENHQQLIELDPAFTFWAYLAVRVFIGIIGGTAFAMFEGAVIAIVRDQRADYGLQRMYGSIGGMISSPLSGMLIDYASTGKGYTDFRPAFYLYAVLKVLSGLMMLSIDLEFKQPAQNIFEDVVTVLRNVELVALFIACFIIGTVYGYIESFLFWLLQDLGASRSLMGITITVGGIAGLPLLVLSGPIISKLGHANVLFIGFVFYAIRLLGYSLIYNPWLCLVFEAMESITSSLAFTAAVTYAAHLSSITTDTSIQGLLGGIYYGVGKGAGSLIGGYLMKFVGTRPTYQIFAGATFITGCFYYLFNRFYLQKKAVSSQNAICEKKPTALDIECRDTNTKETDKKNVAADVASNNVINLNGANTVTSKIIAPNQLNKCTADNIDGSSDSGVDNPAYNDNEISIQHDKEKDDKNIKKKG